MDGQGILPRISSGGEHQRGGYGRRDGVAPVAQVQEPAGVYGQVASGQREGGGVDPAESQLPVYRGRAGHGRGHIHGHHMPGRYRNGITGGGHQFRFPGRGVRPRPRPGAGGWPAAGRDAEVEMEVGAGSKEGPVPGAVHGSRAYRVAGTAHPGGNAGIGPRGRPEGGVEPDLRVRVPGAAAPIFARRKVFEVYDHRRHRHVVAGVAANGDQGIGPHAVQRIEDPGVGA